MMIRSIRVLAVAAALCTFSATGGVHGKPSVLHRARESARMRSHHRHHHRRHRHRARHRLELYGVTRHMMQMAERVSICEEGGDWDYEGTVFDGGIGWTLANWQAFRMPSWPRWMHQASPHMQANALFRFVRHYGIVMPDQSGVCAGY